MPAGTEIQSLLRSQQIDANARNAVNLKMVQIQCYICAGILLGISSLQSGFAAQAHSTGPKARPGAVYRPAYPLKLSENRRYLVDRNNHPFLMVGDTP